MHLVDIAFFREIGGEIVRRDAIRLAHAFGNFLQPVFLPGDEEEVRALFGEHLRQPFANALRCAGDQHPLSFKSQIHFPTLCFANSAG